MSDFDDGRGMSASPVSAETARVMALIWSAWRADIDADYVCRLLNHMQATSLLREAGQVRGLACGQGPAQRAIEPDLSSGGKNHEGRRTGVWKE